MPHTPLPPVADLRPPPVVRRLPFNPCKSEAVNDETGWCRVPGFAVRERDSCPRARAQPPREAGRGGVTDAGACRGLRRDLRPPPPRHRSPPAAGAPRYRHGGDRHAQRHPLPAGAGLRRCRQARRAGETHVPEHGRGRQHGRRLQGRRRALHVCRGGVFRAEVCADEVAARGRRAWPPDPHQAVGKNTTAPTRRTSGMSIAPAAACLRTWAATASPSLAG